MEGGQKKVKLKKKKANKPVAPDEKIKKSERVDLQVRVKKSEPRIEKKDNTKEDIDEPEIIMPTKAERDKMILMWSGVIFFMAVIICFWAFSFKGTISSAKSNKNDKSFNWDEITKMTDEFGKRWDMTKDQLKEMQDALAKESQTLASSTVTATSTLPQNMDVATSSVQNINQADLNNIKAKILELEKNSGNKNN
jgi:hypothetical protein